MKRVAAALGHGTDHTRPLLILGAEVGHGDLELGDHVRVGIHRCRAVAAGVGDVGTVGGDVEGIVGEAVVGVGSIERALIAAVTIAVDTDCLAVYSSRCCSSRSQCRSPASS